MLKKLLPATKILALSALIGVIGAFLFFVAFANIKGENNFEFKQKTASKTIELGNKNEVKQSKITKPENKKTPKNKVSFKSGTKKSLLNLAFADSQKLRGEESGKINFLLLGIPGEKRRASYLTDSILIASLDLKSESLSLLSIPRDMLVKMPDSQARTKINALYKYGMERYPLRPQKLIKNKVEDIIGEDIHYYSIVSLNSIEKIVDKLGKIEVYVEEKINDPKYPAPGFSFQTFKLDKGWQTLDGETTVKYIRTRHNPGGDFGRSERQRQIIKALKEKISSMINNLKVNRLFDVYKSMKKNIHTNINEVEVKRLIKLTGDVNTKEIESVGLTNRPNKKGGLLKTVWTTLGDSSAYTLVPEESLGNYKEIHKLFNKLTE